MKNSKALSLMMILALAGSVMAGCGNGGNNKANSNASETAAPKSSAIEETSSDNKPIKLRIVWWGSQARHDATQKALDLYTKNNPNVTFEKEFSSWDGYWDKLGVQFAAKNAPDLIQMDATYLNDYANRNLLAEITGVDTTSMENALMDTGKVNGKLYGLPLGSNSFGMVYDKVALEKYGITPPQNGWTWDDFFAFCKEAKAKIGEDKYVFVDENIQSFYQYAAYQYGAGKGFPITEDGKFNYDKDTFVEWLTKLNELREMGALPPAEKVANTIGLDPNQDMIIKGSALMGTLNAGQFSSLDSLKPDTFALVTMPAGKEASGWLKPAMYWSVNASSANVEEANKFINWFVNDSEAANILGTTRGIPVSSKVIEQLTPQFTTADKATLEAIANTAKNAQTYKPDPAGWSNFGQKEYKSVYEKYMYGQINPEQAYNELTEIGNQYEAK